MIQQEWIVTQEELRVSKPKRKIRLRENDQLLTEIPCEKCRIIGRDKIVPGEGFPGRAMFIGMCPGEEEAIEGRPFVGKSGRFLRKILSECGFGESDCYFSNVVHCRLVDDKGKNRAPTNEEMKICGSFIQREIAEKNPSLIILLGEQPLKYFLNKSMISKYRGMLFKKMGRTFFVAHHPAYVIRLKQDHKEYKLFRQDMNRAYKILYGIKDEKVGVEKVLCNTKEKVLDALDTIAERKFVLDIETDAPGKIKERKALDPWATDFKITLIGFATRLEDGAIKAFSIPLEHKESSLNFEETFSVLHEFFEKEDLSPRGQNLKWDLKCLKVHFGFNIDSVDFDTLPAHPLLEGKTSHSLERMSIDYLNSDSYKVILRDGRQFGDIPLKELADMNMDDCINNLELAEIFEEELAKSNQLDYYRKNVLAPIPVFKNMEVQGVKVDMDYLEDLKKNLESGIANVFERLRGYKEVDENWGKTFDKVLASNKDLNTILFSKFNFTKPERKTTLGYAVDKKVLKELEMKHQHPFIKDLLEWKGLIKKLNTYISPYYDKGHIKYDGKIHGNIRQDITLTGRLSMENPNLQNIPVREGSEILRLFISSYEGGKIILGDYSQIELRVLAAASRDRKMIEAFMQNRDIHLATAATINGLSYETALSRYEAKDPQVKRMRDESKSVNFGIVYGMTEIGLAEQLGWYTGSGIHRELDTRRASTFIDEYLNIFDGVKEYMNKTIQDWRTKGYVETLFGRRIIIKGGPDRNKNERRAINSPIQGTASDICVMALVEMEKRLVKEELIMHPILTIHDALAFDTPPEEVEIGMILTKNIMESFQYPWMIGIPLKVDVHAGNNLAEAKG
ncbi:hypothetical protein A2Z67_05215 [Candidatus Woesebacteria bacterium RBG_13_36_22]|uniref:DNA-directed DNA polymerase n=1 Tax=Candidatus Woesebacteria bacterium RBG_13_36_22 TaxID=1802478 RepID=A0A1F7X2K2_9BACT|nr:MAG: hypothetical protein A2Z67_05215 [Candidatus Woesebacteria bacterium RBG_13_36_22]